MGVDRRSLLTGLIAAALFESGCARASRKQPAYQWPQFRAAFLLPEGRVQDTGNRGISHSEGQGYALLFAESAGDRDSFDLLWKWTDATLSRSDMRLFSWRYDPAAKQAVNDPNNATDGDMLIAWALLRAAKRWNAPEYLEAARAIMRAISDHLLAVTSAGTVLLPGLQGFSRDNITTTNLSYYVWPALDAFAADDPKSVWGKIIADGETLLATARFGIHQLPPDWLDIRADGALAPANAYPPRFGFDAVRIPLYLALAGRKAALQPFRSFWQACRTAGQPIPAWINLTTGEASPYPASSGVLAIAALALDGSVSRTATPPSGADYYSQVLFLMASGGIGKN